MCMATSSVHRRTLPVTPLGQHQRQGTGEAGKDVPPIVGDVLTSPGEPLDPAIRAFFEPCFGRDLGNVRVHADARAAESARAINARAYTVGYHVVFGTAEYAPNEESGRRLLAHELTHVVQAVGGEPGDRARIPPPRAMLGLPDAALNPASPTTVFRAEPEGEQDNSRTPVEVPPDVSPKTEAFAREKAEEIDDTVVRHWDDASGGGGVGPLVLASQVERILRETFEEGHGWAPQLRHEDAPVLQYFVAQHPGLRERLAILRYRAGARNTERIGKYLDIPLLGAEGFTYEIHMAGASGGKLVEGAAAIVSIRYLEDGKQMWQRSYHFEGAGGGAGVAPWNMNADIGWNKFYTFEYWALEDFVGLMAISAASIAVGIGYEIEGATFYGSGGHAPVNADVGGWILSTADLGFSTYNGHLSLLSPAWPAPPPGREVLPPPPPFVQRPEVRTSFDIRFATDDSRIDDAALARLTAFVENYREVFTGGDYQLTLIGQASRTGDKAYNQQLSEQRVASARAGIALLGAPLDEDHVTEAPIGEEMAEREKLPEWDNSAEYRTVQVILVGRYTRTLPSPQ